MADQAEYVSMYPCIECGEDVEARECYDDAGVLIHAIGVTGQAEPHETGSQPDDLKRVDIKTFAGTGIPASTKGVAMITIDVTEAKRRFGRKPRKQWQFAIKGGNGEPIDPRDTYANVGDIRSILDALRKGPVRLRIHYFSGVREELLQ